MPERVNIYINEQSIEVASGDSVHTAITLYDPQLAAALDGGSAYVTDGVGRTLPLDKSVSVGDILRVVRAAPRPADDPGS